MCAFYSIPKHWHVCLFSWCYSISTHRRDRGRGLTSPGFWPLTGALVDDTEPTQHGSDSSVISFSLFDDICLHPAYTYMFSVKCAICLFSEIRIYMKTMATRKRCKLPRTGQDFENVIKSILCVRIFHTRIGGDLTPAIINRGRPANAEQMGLYASAKHVNSVPLGSRDSRWLNAGFFS